MTLKAELQEIVDEMEFDSDEDRAAFEKSVSGKAGEKLLAGYMKSKDYTTKTQAAAAEKKALEEARKKFDDEQNYVLSQMSTYKSDMEKRLNDAIKQVQESDLRGAALTSKIRTLAATYGEDPDELLKDVKAARAADDDPGKATPFNDEEFNKKYIPREEFTRSANAFFGFAPQIRDFERDYKRTFGKEFDGSITDLVTEASREVEQRRARGQNIDIFGYMKEKLDFNGQAVRNTEAAKTAAEDERKKWEEDKRKEIEQNVRSEYLAQNPGAMRKADQTEDWRANLGAEKRKERQQQQVPARSVQDTFKRQQDIHRAFEERQEKSSAA